MDDQKVINDLIKNAIIIPSGKSEGSVQIRMPETEHTDEHIVCAFCGNRLSIKSESQENKFYFLCDCDFAKEYKSKLNILYEELATINQELIKVKSEIYSQALRTYQGQYELYCAIRDTENEEFDKKILSLDKIEF